MHIFNRLTRLAIASGIAALGFAGFAAAPASAAPAVTVTPTTGLTDQGTVHVSGTGFPARNLLVILQCRPNPTSAVADCSGFTADSNNQSDKDGNFEADFTTYVLPNPLEPTGDPIQCDSTHPCILVVSVNYLDFSTPTAFSSVLTFAGPNPQVPEVPYAALLPLGALGLFGGAYLVLRRRKPTHELAA